jgi:hypothetical protein
MDYRIILYAANKKAVMPIQKITDIETAKREVEKLLEKFEVGVL